MSGGGPEAPETIWPDEIARQRAAFYGIRTAALLANEPRWVHRRVEQLELIDERRARRRISVDFTLPELPRPPWPEDPSLWLVPVALLQKRLLTSLDVRDEVDASLPVLTREQNSAVAYELLAFLAKETLAEVIGPDAEVHRLLLYELSDIAGARRGLADHPSDAERHARTTRAIRRFRAAATRTAQTGIPRSRLQNQRQALWRDKDMRGFVTTLAERFILLVPLAASPGKRRIVKLSYEQPLEVPAIIQIGWRRLPFRQRARSLLRAIRERAGSSFGLDALSFIAPTRAVFGPESYHVEIVAPDELIIEYARLERTTTVTSLENERVTEERTCISEDFCTERAHLYESLYTSEQPRTSPPSANEETTGASAVTVDFFMRPSFVRPSGLIGVLTCGMLATGLILHGIGVARSGDVTALIVVLPAVFAAYLIPGEHRLVRRMFRGVRLLVFMLSVVSFVAAGSLTLSLASSTRFAIWLILLALAALSTATIAAAWWVSTRKMSRRLTGGIHSGNART